MTFKSCFRTQDKGPQILVIIHPKQDVKNHSCIYTLILFLKQQSNIFSFLLL